MRFRCSFALLVGALGMLAGNAVYAQSQVRGRVLVTVDTSGSMLWRFGDCTNTTGDSNNAAVFCDNNIGTGFACNQNRTCTVANGGLNLWPTTSANPGRLSAAKAALNDVINSASGVLDFGLERYTQASASDTGIPQCADASDCCTTQIDGTTRGRCVPTFGITAYSAVSNSVNCGNVIGGTCNTTFSGGCGTSAGCTNCSSTEGGQILIQPGTNSSQQVLRWVDYVEDFCSSNGLVGGPPRNPELRASGATPLAGSVRTARTRWYQPIVQASNGGNCDPTTNPLCDQQINCRPYVHVVMTDGGESCENSSQWFTDPQRAVEELTNANPANPVKTYVIAMSFNQNELCDPNPADLSGAACPKTGGCVTVGSQQFCACRTNADCGRTCDNFQYTCGADGICHHPALDSLNAMAAAGGTGRARFANSQADISAAFADIVSSSVRFEVCNNQDDNCNNEIDEGFNKGVSCSVGVGICRRTGITKCSPNNTNSTACCVNDSDPNCTTLDAGTPVAEVCNGQDDDCDGIIDDGGVCQTCNPTAEVCDGVDNDCNNIVDDNLIDTGLQCGLNLGICTYGQTVCVAGALQCQGATLPRAETCNGLDDNCDGVVDGMTQSCYTGPPPTADVGRCRSGEQRCTNGTTSTCLGEVLPTSETCNGIDDNCNGTVDDVPGAGTSCCPSDRCGTGQCTSGTLRCSGGGLQCLGAVGPTGETCDGVDNDCNGTVDDVPGLGAACQVAGTACPGRLVCNPTGGGVICEAATAASPEVCDGIDNNCNGLIDEEPALSQNDQRIGQPCGNDQNLPAPCASGRTVCQNGRLLCQGAVVATPEVCDGRDNNCDGTVDNGASCPVGYDCISGQCLTRCAASEFPCPGGFVCDRSNNHCTPLVTCNPACGQCEQCLNGVCVDRCQGISCQGGFRCLCGSCIEDSCVTNGCPSGQVCNRVTRQCVADPCANVQCGTNQFCDPATRNCVGVCPVTCPQGQSCVNGNCVGDPCTGINCPSGQICNPANLSCVADPCGGRTCVGDLVCVNGDCVSNPCLDVRCPIGATCRVDSRTGSVRCEQLPREPPDQVVGAGGGGFACSVGPGPAAQGGGSGVVAMLGLVLAGLWLRRRPSATKSH